MKILWIKDKWWGKDKRDHFLLHFGIVLFYRFIFLDVWGGIATSILWGCLYELYDSVRGVGASWRDIVWNCLGAITGGII